MDKAMLVAGPAIEIFPISSIRVYPESITAPGEIILKGKRIEMNVKMAPQRVNRNSAHKPRRCAATLCAISCARNDPVIMAAMVEKTKNQFAAPK